MVRLQTFDLCGSPLKDLEVTSWGSGNLPDDVNAAHDSWSTIGFSVIKNGYIQGEKFYIEIPTICLLKLQKNKYSFVLFFPCKHSVKKKTCSVFSVCP